MAAVVAAWTAAATTDDTIDSVVVVAAAATDETDAMVVVVLPGGKTVVVFAASGRASEGEGRGGGGRGEGGVGVRTPLVVASCVAWRRAKRAALSVASSRAWASGAESTPGAAAVALRTADVVLSISGAPRRRCCGCASFPVRILWTWANFSSIASLEPRSWGM